MILFYGHDPKLPYACFSNWYPAMFDADGYTYFSSEQYMMHQKALLFNDTKIASKIMEEQDPRQIKRLGRKVKPFDPIIWNGYKQIIVYKGLWAKFSQNQYYAEKLLDTGNEILVEASPKDTVWGIGLGKTNPDAKDMSKWKGENLLGFTLMQVRDNIRNKRSFLS